MRSASACLGWFSEREGERKSLASAYVLNCTCFALFTWKTILSIFALKIYNFFCKNCQNRKFFYLKYRIRCVLNDAITVAEDAAKSFYQKFYTTFFVPKVNAVRESNFSEGECKRCQWARGRAKEQQFASATNFENHMKRREQFEIRLTSKYAFFIFNKFVSVSKLNLFEAIFSCQI